MSGKLDQSLEEITSAQRRGRGRRQQPARSVNSRPTPAAPVGGIKKNTKTGGRGAAAKAAPAKAQAASRDSKVIVSNLPKDVTQAQIKEYFQQILGGVKKVDLVYGPNSQSRGIANVVFSRADGASTAFKKLNGLLVDGHPMKVEIVVGAADAGKVIQAPKSLAERTTQTSKAQPKSAANDKQKNGKGAVKKAANGKAGGKERKPRNARPAKKTGEELDADMADYFVSSNTNENAEAAPAAANSGGDAPMEDEIS